MAEIALRAENLDTPVPYPSQAEFGRGSASAPAALP